MQQSLRISSCNLCRIPPDAPIHPSVVRPFDDLSSGFLKPQFVDSARFDAVARLAADAERTVAELSRLVDIPSIRRMQADMQPTVDPSAEYGREIVIVAGNTRCPLRRYCRCGRFG
jgi:hypothetical protein